MDRFHLPRHRTDEYTRGSWRCSVRRKQAGLISLPTAVAIGSKYWCLPAHAKFAKYLRLHRQEKIFARASLTIAHSILLQGGDNHERPVARPFTRKRLKTYTE
jgi:transposase